MTPEEIETHIAASQFLLGDLMLNGNVDGLRDRIAAAPLHVPVHRKIRAAILARFDAGATLADPVMIHEDLKGDPDYEESGGLAYLADLVCIAADDLLISHQGTMH